MRQCIKGAGESPHNSRDAGYVAKHVETKSLLHTVRQGRPHDEARDRLGRELRRRPEDHCPS